MKTIRAFAAIAALTIGLSASAQTNLPEFTKIKVFGRMDVSIKYGQPQSVTVKAGKTDNVTYKVVDGQLQINGEALTRQSNVVVTVGCPKLDAVELGGNAKCFNSGAITTNILHLEAGAGTELDLLIESDSVDLLVARGGFARLNGKARAVKLKTSSGGSYAADEMENSVLYAEMGGGIARTKTNDRIVADLAEKATLIYTGSPKIETKEGSKGEIKPDEE
ncbi:MAG: DUF2807 domain-containing protein [Salinivirgaceae bacterium]|nr:DUF2807 domain-containing protein [Salinivirgaceae bacterium]